MAFNPTYSISPETAKALMAIEASRAVVDSLGIGARQARELCAKWTEEGFLVVENPSKKARSYRLANRYEDVLL